MKTRKLIVTLEVEFYALEGQELKDSGFFQWVAEDGNDGGDAAEVEPPTLDDYEAREMADLLPGVIESTENEMFAGTGIFAKVREAKITNAHWFVKL